MSADKIGAQHRARKAVLYVRQSSAHQVQHNRESQVLQYAMRERLVQLGWSEIEVIDDDLGGCVAKFAAGCEWPRYRADQAATWNSSATKLACARMSRPRTFRTCPFLTIAIAS